MGYGNDEPQTVTSSTRHVTVQYLVTSSSDVSGGLMASYVTLGTTNPAYFFFFFLLVMAALYNRAGHYIFALWFLLLLSSFFLA